MIEDYSFEFFVEPFLYSLKLNANRKNLNHIVTDIAQTFRTLLIRKLRKKPLSSKCDGASRFDRKFSTSNLQLVVEGVFPFFISESLG